MLKNKTMRGSHRMVMVHLSSRWKKWLREGRQVVTTMVLRMTKMRTMRPRRLTELIISNKHE